MSRVTFNAENCRTAGANLLLAAMLLSTTCFTPFAAQAATISLNDNWEFLTFLPNQPFSGHRNYLPGEFNAVSPNWKVNTEVLNGGYGVEHQHSLLTWGQTGTNDDFLEIDAIIGSVPQIVSTFVPEAGKQLVGYTVNFQAAGRPDLRGTERGIKLYGRAEGETQWTDLGGDFWAISGSSAFPEFNSFVLSSPFLQTPITGRYQIGFGCRSCEQAPGAGYLLGNVALSFHTQDRPAIVLPPLGPPPPTGAVPEPATMLMLGAGLIGAATRKNLRAA